MKRIAIVPLATLLALASPLHAQSLEPFTISDIRVDGLQRISAGTVFTYLPLQRATKSTRPPRPEPSARCSAPASSMM